MQLLPSFILVSVILFITLIHEMGHLVLAKALKVPVQTFAIGFGPNLYTYEDKQRTKWSINLIPLGGYISIAPPDSNETDAMLSISPIKRIIVALGGPLFNVISFFMAGAIFYNHIGPKSYTYELSQDKGQKTEYVVYKSSDHYLVFDKTHNTTTFAPIINEDINQHINDKNLDHYPLTMNQSLSLCKYQCTHTFKMIITTFTSLEKLKSIRSILSTTKDINKTMKNSNKSAWIVFIIYFILFSLNIGLFNLLPFFGLDGGWILISVINLFVKFGKRGERILVTVLNYGTMLLFAAMFVLVARDLLDIVLEFFI